MKDSILIIVFMSVAVNVFAQHDLIFENEKVKSVTIIDNASHFDNNCCLIQYIDSCKLLIVSEKHLHNEKSHIYIESLIEIQSLLKEITRYRTPTSDALEVDAEEMNRFFNAKVIRKKYYDLFMEPNKEDRKAILHKYQSIDLFNKWLTQQYPVLDSGQLKINTAHDLRCIKIIIQTDNKIYYFDMRDIELFQPYLMRTSDLNCIKFITNFNVNKHIRNLFRLANIHRNVPWKEALINSYILWCAEDSKYSIF